MVPAELLLIVLLPIVLVVVVLLVAVLAAVLLTRGRKACLHEQALELPLAPEVALERCRAALLQLDGGARLAPASAAARGFEAVVGLTFWSWGERITVTAEPLGKDRTLLRLQSWCRLGTTLQDWGKNAGNVARLAEAVQRQGDAIEVRTRAGGLSRCAYCHDDLDPAAAVACVGCLARHHAGCWDDHGACAACREVDRFVGVERTPGAPEKAPPPRAREKG